MRTGNVIALGLGLLLAAMCATAGPTYRWVDADGVHYSDQPHAGADRIILGQTQTYNPGPAPVTSTPSARNSRARAARNEFHYDRCQITAPAEDQVLIDVESVTVSVQLQPSKRPGDRLLLSLDGKAMQAPGPQATEFTIKPIDRGTHTAVASIRDAGDAVVCESKLVTFHVRQPSVLAPLNPQRHH